MAKRVKMKKLTHMKKSQVMLLASCILLLGQNCLSAKTDSDVQIAGLNGKVKKQVTLSSTWNGTRDTTTEAKYISISAAEFNIQGTLLKREFTFNSSSPTKVTVCRTNKQGLTSSKVEKNGQGILQSTLEFEYDSSGNVIREKRRGRDGKLQTEKVSTYDAQGNLVSQATYGGTKNLFGTTKYKFDENNNVIYYEYLNAKNEKVNSTKYFYENGNKVKTENFSARKGKGRTEHFGYNKEGLMTYSETRHKETVTRRVFLYDQNGNIALTESTTNGVIKKKQAKAYDQNNNVIEEKDYTYRNGQEFMVQTNYKVDEKGNWTYKETKYPKPVSINVVHRSFEYYD